MDYCKSTLVHTCWIIMDYCKSTLVHTCWITIDHCKSIFVHCHQMIMDHHKSTLVHSQEIIMSIVCSIPGSILLKCIRLFTYSYCTTLSPNTSILNYQYVCIVINLIPIKSSPVMCNLSHFHPHQIPRSSSKTMLIRL